MDGSMEEMKGEMEGGREGGKTKGESKRTYECRDVLIEAMEQ